MLNQQYLTSRPNDVGKILPCNPDEIAFEMLNSGLDISWLYPEMPVVANEIENRKVMI